jgi:hypothetical protein
MPKAKPPIKQYVIPAPYLQGTLADMLFWDALYFLLATKGEQNRAKEPFFETDYDELQALTGLTRKTLRKQIDTALPVLAVEAGVRGFAFVLKFKGGIGSKGGVGAKGGKKIQKTTNYMANGWGWVLCQPYPTQTKSSRFPLAILNLFWRKPAGRTIGLAEIGQRCRKANARKLPDPKHITQAVAHLLALGLLQADTEGQFLLVRQQFQVAGRQVWERVQAEAKGIDGLSISTKQQKRFINATTESPVRANLAQEIINKGQFDFETHFLEIFYDLAYIQLDTDLPALFYAVHRHRHRPASKDRWVKCRHLFQNTLKKQSQIVTSPKIQFDFTSQTHHQTNLTLPADPRPPRWGKLVLWLNDKQFASSGRGQPFVLQVALQSNANPIWQTTLTYENEIVRCSLTTDLQQQSSICYELTATIDHPTRQLTLEAQLEVEYVHGR